MSNEQLLITHYSLLITHFSFLISHLLSFICNPASSVAGRIPPCGGIARPKGKHSRRMTVFCPSPADSRQERDKTPKGMKTLRVFAPRSGTRGSTAAA
jgi:hypothetical protein